MNEVSVVAGGMGDRQVGLEMSDEMRAKWAQRLSVRVDRQDSGQVLARTGAALAVEDPVESVKALSVALAHERVIVPVNVERHPDRSGVHEYIDPHSDDAPQFRVVNTFAGLGVVAFTSVEELQAFDPLARPMPLDFRKVALSALRDGAARVVLNPAGVTRVLPRPLVAALAQGDSWLPAWEDHELLDELVSIAAERNVAGRIHGVRLRPHEGGSAVMLEVVATLPDDSQQSVSWLMDVHRALLASPRLKVAADAVVVQPEVTFIARGQG